MVGYLARGCVGLMAVLVKAWLCSGQPHLPAASWPLSASFRPLDVYIYVFGSKSCRNRLKRATAVRLAAPNKAKLAFSTTLDAASTRRASRPRSAGRPLPRQSSSIRVAWLRRATTWLAPRRRASLPCSRLAALVANRSRPACSASPPVAIRRVSLAPHRRSRACSSPVQNGLLASEFSLFGFCQRIFSCTSPFRPASVAQERDPPAFAGEDHARTRTMRLEAASPTGLGL